MAENENLASILVKSGLISIFTNSPIGYFSKFANDLAFNIRPINLDVFCCVCIFKLMIKQRNAFPVRLTMINMNMTQHVNMTLHDKFK